MSNENVINMMRAASQAKPHDFARSFTSEVTERLQSAVEAQRATVISRMFNEK